VRTCDAVGKIGGHLFDWAGFDEVPFKGSDAARWDILAI